MKKQWQMVLAALLLATGSLYAGKGKIRVAADQEGAYIYVDGKKKAMTGEGFTSILLEEGEYTIKVVKPKDKYMGYIAQKRVFVGEDTSTKMSLKLQLDAIVVEKIWDKTFGGKKYDVANSIAQSQDGGFVVAGYTSSKGAGKSDIWIVNIDKDGNKIWDKTFGGKSIDEANTIIQSQDGGFVVVGFTLSKGAGKSDIWIVKIDKDGNKIWDKTFGGEKWDKANAIIQSQDGGFVVAGYTESKGVGKRDAWIVKIDKDGNKIWDKTFGGKSIDEAISIIQSQDGGFVVAGYTGSKGAWIVKIDKDGNKVWDKTLGGEKWDKANAITQSQDGGFVVAGYTESKGAGGKDIWIVKIDKDGNKIWDKTFGGKDYDKANTIIQSQDGGFIVVGFTLSKGAGSYDAWIVKIDKDGNKIWDKTFGGKKWDEANTIIHAQDGGFVVAGYTESKGAGEKDAWLIKIKDTK